MKVLKALIIEDNAFMATALREMLQDHVKEVSIIGQANTGKEALILIATLNPDVIFLDIELPDMTGFEMLSQLSEIRFKTIFTTAHSQYAIKAFRFNALDYLVKPVKETELSEALRRLRATDRIQKGIINALENLETTNVEEQKFFFPSQQGIIIIHLKDITHIEGERNYSYIHKANGKKVLLSKNLAYFESKLDSKIFFRCHRSYIVNGHHIGQLKVSEFILMNKLAVPISRRKKLDARNWFARSKF